jgi:peroxiredoxin Q/BCP
MLKEGNKAPDFTLLDDRGKKVKLSELTDKKEVVLFFYPKADTPGCTREACGFRDIKAQFTKRGALILGISPDDVNRQAKFRDKYNLNMPLLADPERKIATKYGVFKEKKMYGKTVMGIERTTFIIGKDRRIKKIFPKVKVDGHVEKVLEALKTG